MVKKSCDTFIFVHKCQFNYDSNLKLAYYAQQIKLKTWVLYSGCKYADFIYLNLYLEH